MKTNVSYRSSWGADKQGHSHNKSFAARARSTLALKTEIQASHLPYNHAPTCWATIQVKAQDVIASSMGSSGASDYPVVDFVFVLDVSASMKNNNRMGQVLAGLGAVFDTLGELNTISVVTYNHIVSTVCKYEPATTSNLKKLEKHLRDNIKPHGSTNISDALFTALSLFDAPEYQAVAAKENRVPAIFLFTDGASNRGLSNQTLIQQLKRQQKQKSGNGSKQAVIHTFGIGDDHDSALLYALANETRGMYYFVENGTDMVSALVECANQLTTTCATDATVFIKAQDGARIITLATNYAIEPHKKLKEYSVNVGRMSRGETKTIIVKLSLRRMNKPMDCHKLLKVQTTYSLFSSGAGEQIYSELNVQRPQVCEHQELMPVDLDQNLSRFKAAITLVKASKLATNGQFLEAQQMLSDASNVLRNGHAHNYRLLSDIEIDEMLSELQNKKTFHTLFAHASRFFMEKPKYTAAAPYQRSPLYDVGPSPMDVC